METLRHIPSNDDQWPDASLPDDAPSALEEKLLLKLGEVAARLEGNPHDGSRPDLFGQAYRQLFDATFHAVLNGRNDLARRLFPVAITTADRARGRLVDDLAGERWRERAIFGTEPLVDMMELSGYALLMSELDPTGLWPDVRALWDRIFAAETAPALAQQLASVLALHENLFAVTSGGVGRTNRQMELGRVFAERGIGTNNHYWEADVRTEHESPIVATFARRDLIGISGDLADLFVVEYLVQRPEFAGLAISRGAERLQDSLRRRRESTDSSIQSDDEEGYDH
jgi:hypothetical protein